MFFFRYFLSKNQTPVRNEQKLITFVLVFRVNCCAICWAVGGSSSNAVDGILRRLDWSEQKIVSSLQSHQMWKHKKKKKQKIRVGKKPNEEPNRNTHTHTRTHQIKPKIIIIHPNKEMLQITLARPSLWLTSSSSSPMQTFDLDSVRWLSTAYRC